MTSIRSRILIALIVPVVLLGLTLLLALSLPQSDGHFYLHQGELVVDLPERQPGLRVLSFALAGEPMPARPEFVIEEPDVMPSHAQIHQLMQQVGELSQALEQGELWLQTPEGDIHLVARQRQLEDLPAMFWAPVISAFVGLLICTLVWIPGDLNAGKWGYILTGISYFLLTAAAAIYGGRELFIPEYLFRLMSVAGLWGTELFMAGLILFFWNYPRPLLSARYNRLVLLSPFILILLAAVPLHDALAVTTYLPFYILLLLAVAGLIRQWQVSRQQAEDRAALRWMLLFVSAVSIPTVLKVYAPVPQAVMTSSFVFVYMGMLFAVMRYRFLNLQDWSLRLWGWFLGGLAVLLTDLILATLVAGSPASMLAFALAIVGWLYFPVRQWLWRRFFTREQGLENWLTQALPELLQPQADRSQAQRVQQALQAVFTPLTIERCDDDGSSSRLDESGNALVVALADGQGCLRLRHAGEGRRLFERSDLHIAGLVLALDDLVCRSRAARQEGALEGAREERVRMQKDLHDDLGARLLQLLYRCAPEEQPLVRAAIRDLRSLLHSRSDEPVALQAVAEQWHDEAASRCQDHQITLHWQQQLSPCLLPLSALEQVGRALREAISNAIRHRHEGDIRVTLRHDGHELHCQVMNDCLNTITGDGMGLANIHARMQAIGGQAEIHQNDHTTGWQVSLRLPIPLPLNDSVC